MLLRHDAFRRLVRAREMLASDRRLTIADVAREAHISPYHFIRQFESLFGQTPHQFRIQARLDRAKLLLAEGGRSVTDVCFEVGFESLGSFSDLFSRRVGMSPSEYQRHATVAPGCLALMGLAFRNFREAQTTPLSLECGNANQTHQHHGV